jgi:DNA-binding transcriptional regulator GbsR (MarR family)
MEIVNQSNNKNKNKNRFNNIKDYINNNPKLLSKRSQLLSSIELINIKQLNNDLMQRNKDNSIRFNEKNNIVRINNNKNGYDCYNNHYHCNCNKNINSNVNYISKKQLETNRKLPKLLLPKIQDKKNKLKNQKETLKPIYSYLNIIKPIKLIRNNSIIEQETLINPHNSLASLSFFKVINSNLI